MEFRALGPLEVRVGGRRLNLGGVPPNAVVICAIGGAAGVGKTALAVHWAHRVPRRHHGPSPPRTILT